MTQISLVAPFRARLDDLDILMKSLRENTSDQNNIEIILVIDRCDAIVFPIMRELENKYKDNNLTCYDVERSDHHSKDYYNYAAKKAKGRWIMAINDDSVFMTKDWDLIVIEKMGEAARKQGDDILFGIVNDGMRVKGVGKGGRAFSCFPMLSKEYCELMDGILIEEIYTWGGDYWLGRVFNHVRNGTRRVQLQDVFVDHNSHHNQKAGKEQGVNFVNFQRIEKEHPSTFNSRLVSIRSEKINTYIKEKR